MSHPPKLRGSSRERRPIKREGTDGRQIVESQALGPVAQAAPQAKNAESPGERGPAARETEKKEGIAS
jgi:hypothetical protein